MSGDNTFKNLHNEFQHPHLQLSTDWWGFLICGLKRKTPVWSSASYHIYKDRWEWQRAPDSRKRNEGIPKRAEWI